MVLSFALGVIENRFGMGQNGQFFFFGFCFADCFLGELVCLAGGFLIFLECRFRLCEEEEEKKIDYGALYAGGLGKRSKVSVL